MIDHVGWLVRDLYAGVVTVTLMVGVAVDRTVDRPQWSLFGYYVGTLEVFTFTDPELLDERLGGADPNAKLDHVAYAIDDIDAAMQRLSGARFSGPALRDEAREPFDL